MTLEYLKIIVEKKGAVLVFQKSSAIKAQFNPETLAFNKTVNWEREGSAQRDVPELQFTNAQPRTLKIDLIFDTYDTPEAKKKDVRKDMKELQHLTTVEQHGDKHRPPVCRLSWGAAGVFFQGVLESLGQQFTLFMDNGTPVRAKCACSFKEWRTNYDDLNIQKTESSDVAKSHTVKVGESLDRIAAERYGDSRLWRPIADANDIEDPLHLTPGTVLLIPILKAHERYRSPQF